MGAARGYGQYGAGDTAIVFVCFTCGCCESSTTTITKTCFKVEPLYGVPYGSVFEPVKKKLVRVDGKLDVSVDIECVVGRADAGGEVGGACEEGGGASHTTSLLAHHTTVAANPRCTKM